MKLTPYLFPLIFLLAAGSCTNRETSQKLKDIESYIQQRPDSALSALYSIDTTSLNTKTLRAKYSLLHATALDKNYIDTSDVSIIEPALKYYTGKDRNAMMTHYYAGRIYENGGNLSDALINYTSALEMVDDDDYKYQGLLYSAIANTYHCSFVFEEELAFHQKAYNAFSKLGDSYYIDLATIGLANAYHNNREFHKADSLYQEVCARGDDNRPVALIAKLAIADNLIKSEEFDNENVRALFEEVIAQGGILGLEDYYEYAYILTRLGESDLAGGILQSLSAYPDTYSSYWWKSMITQENGDFKTANEMLAASLELQNLLVRDKLTQSVFKSLSDFYHYEMLSATQRHTIQRQRLLLVVLLFSIVLASIIVVYQLRKRLFQKEKQKLLLTIAESEDMLKLMSNDAQLLQSEHEELVSQFRNEQASHKEMVLALQRMYAGLYQKQFSDIGRYYDATYLYDKEGASQNIIRKVSSDINSILSEISDQSDGQQKFEARINKNADDIVSKLRTDYPKFSESDIRFICYMVAGFDATTISVLMNISTDNVRVKRSRIRHRILSNEGPNAALYRVWLA